MIGTGCRSGMGAEKGQGPGRDWQELALTTCPDVHRFAIGLFAQDLGGQVARCACKSWDRDRQMGEERQVSHSEKGQGQDTVQDTGLGHGHGAGMDMMGTGQDDVNTEAWAQWVWDRAVVGMGQMQ